MLLQLFSIKEHFLRIWIQFSTILTQEQVQISKMHKHVFLAILIAGQCILATAQYGIPDYDEEDLVHLHQRALPEMTITNQERSKSSNGPQTVKVRIEHNTASIRMKRQSPILQIQQVQDPVRNTERVKLLANVPFLASLGSWEIERPTDNNNYETFYQISPPTNLQPPQYQAPPQITPQTYYQAPQTTTPQPYYYQEAATTPQLQYQAPPPPTTLQPYYQAPPPTTPAPQYQVAQPAQYVPPPPPPSQYQVLEVEAPVVPLVKNTYTYSYIEEVPKQKNEYTWNYKGLNGRSYKYKWIADENGYHASRYAV